MSAQAKEVIINGKKIVIEEKVDLHGFKYWTAQPADVVKAAGK